MSRIDEAGGVGAFEKTDALVCGSGFQCVRYLMAAFQREDPALLFATLCAEHRCFIVEHRREEALKA